MGVTINPEIIEILSKYLSEKDFQKVYEYMSDLKYYGSDLNKFIDKKCPHVMTVNNIDLIMLKNRDRKIHLIESKHTSEYVKKTQKKVLGELCKIFTVANNDDIKTYKTYIFICYADSPYENMIINDLINNKEYELKTNKDIIKWLCFDLELNEEYEVKKIDEEKK